MTFDFTINIATIITIAVIAGGGVAAWVTIRLQVRANAAAIADMVKEAGESEKQASTMMGAITATMKLNADRMEKIRAKTAHELAEFKLQVAKEYATNATLREVKEEVVKAINQLSDRIYKQIDAQRRDGSG
jgi:hypothetical protein